MPVAVGEMLLSKAEAVKAGMKGKGMRVAHTYRHADADARKNARTQHTTPQHTRTRTRTRAQARAHTHTLTYERNQCRLLRAGHGGVHARTLALLPLDCRRAGGNILF